MNLVMVVHELGQDKKDSFVKIKNCTPFHIHAEHQLLHTPSFTFNNNFASFILNKIHLGYQLGPTFIFARTAVNKESVYHYSSSE